MSYTILTVTSHKGHGTKSLGLAFANKSVFAERNREKKLISNIQVNLLCTYLKSWLQSLLCLLAGPQQHWRLVSPFALSLLLSQWVPVDRAYGYTLRNHIKPDSAKISTAKRCFEVLPFKSNFPRQLCFAGRAAPGCPRAADGAVDKTVQRAGEARGWRGAHGAAARSGSCPAPAGLVLLSLISRWYLSLSLLNVSAQLKGYCTKPPNLRKTAQGSPANLQEVLKIWT